MNKKGENLLTGNVIFIALNLIFLSILIGFIFLNSADTAILEQNYAKQIALMIDSSDAGSRTVIVLNLKDIKGDIEKGVDWSKIIKISGNTVVVKFRKKGGSSYNFFSDVNANAFPKDNKNYAIVIEKKTGGGNGK